MVHSTAPSAASKTGIRLQPAGHDHLAPAVAVEVGQDEALVAVAGEDAGRHAPVALGRIAAGLEDRAGVQHDLVGGVVVDVADRELAVAAVADAERVAVAGGERRGSSTRTAEVVNATTSGWPSLSASPYAPCAISSRPLTLAVTAPVSASSISTTPSWRMVRMRQAEPIRTRSTKLNLVVGRAADGLAEARHVLGLARRPGQEHPAGVAAGEDLGPAVAVDVARRETGRADRLADLERAEDLAEQQGPARSATTSGANRVRGRRAEDRLPVAVRLRSLGARSPARSPSSARP